MKNGKAPEIDEIPVELSKYAGGESVDRLYKLLCQIYN